MPMSRFTTANRKLSTMPLTWRNKTRRPHTKSRNGCVRCKRQRRKCDECLPSCSRCAELNIECQYLKTTDTEARRSQEVSCPESLNVDLHEPRDSVQSPSTSITPSEEFPPGSIPFEENTFDPQCIALSNTTYNPNEALQLSHLPPLNAQDLELLTHYLTHTSQTIPYDKADLYALHIGIPNLAFSSKPLMSSMLALAAVCQGYDLLPMTDQPCGDLPLSRIQNLLEHAEKHHRSSLQQIQTAIGTERYDTVLANATLMTLYGSAVHCVRIRLISLHKLGRLGAPLPNEFVPAHSQWISLIRAVHCAFIGLRADAEFAGLENKDSASPSSFQDIEGEDIDIAEGVGEVKCSQDGPSETTLRLFLPIVTATIGGAMQTLRTRVQWMRDEITNANNLDIQACTRALEILESIVAENLPGINVGNKVSIPERANYGFIGRLSLVAPWLRAYTARVTSNSSGDGGACGSFKSCPLRRKITAFLNRVDIEFLGLVQERLERMAFVEFGETRRCSEDESAAIQCAMDIFAHWLVLMCLLDGVWWIGGIGMWELGRVVTCMKEPDYGGSGQDKEAWWPASMYTIGMELAKQRV